MRTERRRRWKERGSILAHVLVASVVAAVISAAIMRMAMFRYKLATRNEFVTKEKRDDTGALSAVVTQWATVPGPTSVCSGPPPGWTGCSNPGTCACTCTQPGATPVTVTASCVAGAPQSAGCGAGNTCRLTITSFDRMPAQQ